MPRRAALQPADVSDADAQKQGPSSSSLDPVAQNLAKLRTHWKWAAFSQFFFTFSQLFNMEDVSLTDIEDDLAQESNIFLPRVMARLLFVLSYDRKVSLDNWQSALRKQHKRRDPTSNPIGAEPYTGPVGPHFRYESVSVDNSTPVPEAATAEPDEDGAVVDADVAASEKASSAPANSSRANSEEKESLALEPAAQEQDDQVQEETKDWLDLPMLDKLDSMHLVCEWQFQNPTRLRTLMKSDDDDATWRIEPIGYDAKSNAYWLIGAHRLWIQRSLPKPPATSPLKRKRQEATSKSKRPAAKRARLGNEAPAKIIVPGGGRAAKAQAKIKLDAQAKDLAELNRAAGISGSGRRSASHKSPGPARVLGTRVSARLRGTDDDEWQAVPEDWLANGSTRKKAFAKRRPKTGLESDDDSVSELTELSEDPAEETKEEAEDNNAAADVEQTADSEGDKPPDNFIEWETICVTLEDWEHIAERFEKGTHYTEKALHKVLVKEIVPVITEELREIVRKRRLEEAIVHRKRSSRIAVKEKEKEDARVVAQQKAEVAEKKSRAQRLEARLAKEEAERERREAAREQRRMEREAQEAQEAEVEREDTHVDVVGDNRSGAPRRANSAISRQNAIAPPSTSTSGTRTPMGDDWMLNCEICRRSGVNVDDGVPLLCCGLCSQWQHIACHDQADKRAGRPPRNWDLVEFMCRQCQAQRMVAKSARNHSQPAVSNPYLAQVASFPSNSYLSYGHGPPIALHQQQQYPGPYPVAVNSATYLQPNSSSSRHPQYPPSSFNYNPHGQPAPPPTSRPTAAPSYNSLSPQQQHQGAYNQQFQQIPANLNGHRATSYQRPVANASSWNEPQVGYNGAYPTSNGLPIRTDSDHLQYGDGAQWRTGAAPQAATYRYHSGQ